MAGVRRGGKLSQYMSMDGVSDLGGIPIKGNFAKALMLEDEAGVTTPEALAALDKALVAEAKMAEDG